MLAQMEGWETGRDQSIWSSLKFLSTINSLNKMSGKEQQEKCEALDMAPQKQHEPVRIGGWQDSP